MATNAYAQGFDQRYDFHIEEETLGSALDTLAQFSGVQLVYPHDLASMEEIPPVIGQHTIDEALGILLRHTGFSGGLTKGGVIVIALNQDREEAPMTSGTLKKSLLASVGVLMFGAAHAQDVERVEDDKKQEVDNITVTGSNIRGGNVDSAPIGVYDAEDIRLSGATTIDRFLETLPQNLNSQAPLADLFGPGRGGNYSGGGIDLRGLGVGTTLVLLNGRRLAAPSGGSADTSLIPFSAIERVEVLSDGASAVYGSDAIGGVVNMILREDIDGAQLETSYGTVTDGSHDRFQANMSAGTSWDQGSGLFSYSFSDQTGLMARDRDFATTLSPTNLIPNERRDSMMGVIDQDLSGRVSVFGNVLYSRREADNETSFDRSFGIRRFEVETEQEQIFVSTGLEYEISDGFFFEIHGGYLDHSMDSRQLLIEGSGIDFKQVDEGTSLDLTAKLDGKFLELPGGDLRFSVGAGYSEQDYTESSGLLKEPLSSRDFDRNSYFTFAEIFAPLIGEEQGVKGINRLELSAAIRYTEYSDFGGGSTPRFGLLWSPVSGLNLRGTYSKSFRAPTLRRMGAVGNGQIFSPAAFDLPDTFSSDGSSIFMFVQGSTRNDLVPETSDSFTFGFDLEPANLRNLKVSLTYYNIDYTDRLGSPVPGFLAPILDQDTFRFAFNPIPSLADFEDIAISSPRITDSTGLLTDPSDPAAQADIVTVLADFRQANLARSKVDGLDMSMDYLQETKIGNLSLGANLTYTLNSFQRAQPNAVDVTLLDTVGNPTALKFTAHTGFSRGGFSSQLNLHYVDSYSDINQSPDQPIDSWTTVDLNMGYHFGDNRNGIFRDVALSLSVNNLLDQDPPFVDVSALGLERPVGFDPTNANPIGRFVTVGLTKQF